MATKLVSKTKPSCRPTLVDDAPRMGDHVDGSTHANFRLGRLRDVAGDLDEAVATLMARDGWWLYDGFRHESRAVRVADAGSDAKSDEACD